MCPHCVATRPVSISTSPSPDSAGLLAVQSGNTVADQSVDGGHGYWHREPRTKFTGNRFQRKQKPGQPPRETSSLPDSASFSANKEQHAAGFSVLCGGGGEGSGGGVGTRVRE